MKRFTIISALVLITDINIACTGVVVGETRTVYPVGRSKVQVILKNEDSDKRYLVQSWVSSIDDSRAPFVITPSIYKLDENRQTLLHVVYTGNRTALLQDHESLFMASVRSVSTIPEELYSDNTLQSTIRAKLKLFYRLASLRESEAKIAWQSLQFSRGRNQLVVENPTPFYVTLDQPTVTGKVIKSVVDQHSPSALTMMVAPFAEQRFPLSSGTRGDIARAAINDFGSETGQRKQPL